MKKPKTKTHKNAEESADDALPAIPGLSPTQVRAIELLVMGVPIAAVATSIGRDSSRIYRWRHENETFIAALSDATSRGLPAAIERMKCLRESAINVLETLLSNDDVPHAVRLAAAREVLDRTGLGDAVVRGAAVESPVNQAMTAEDAAALIGLVSKTHPEIVAGACARCDDGHVD